MALAGPGHTQTAGMHRRAGGVGMGARETQLASEGCRIGEDMPYAHTHVSPHPTTAGITCQTTTSNPLVTRRPMASLEGTARAVQCRRCYTRNKKIRPCKSGHRHDIRKGYLPAKKTRVKVAGNLLYGMTQVHIFYNPELGKFQKPKGNPVTNCP